MSISENFAFMQALMKVENGIKSGYDKEKDTWSPHPSPEGGLPTLGYGHKLEQRDIDNGDIFIKGVPYPVWGLHDDLVVSLFIEDVKHYESIAKAEWNQYRPGDSISWDWLDEKYKCVLTNLTFNLGSLAPGGKLQWPMLFLAIKNRNDADVRKHMVTTYKRPDGVRVRLEKRAKQIADAVGLAS